MSGGKEASAPCVPFVHQGGMKIGPHAIGRIKRKRTTRGEIDRLWQKRKRKRKWKGKDVKFLEPFPSLAHLPSSLEETFI